MSSADEVFGIFDELVSIFSADQRTAGIKEYVLGEKDQGLQFPTMFMLPEDDTHSGDDWPLWDIKAYLVLILHSLDIAQGKRDAMRLAYDASDILTSKKTLNGKVHSVKVNRIAHNSGKDKQGRALHWELLDVTIRRKVFVDGTVATDSWLEALCKWTEAQLPGWTVYRNTYPEDYTRPGVIWRLTGASAREKTSAVFEVRKTFQGQIVGILPYQQAFYGAIKVVEGLRRDIKIVLDAANKRYLTIYDPVANVKTDISSPAQITVELFRATSRPTEETPYIMHIEGSGKLS